jgi:hypothetical protein
VIAIVRAGIAGNLNWPHVQASAERNQIRMPQRGTPIAGDAPPAGFTVACAQEHRFAERYRFAMSY